MLSRRDILAGAGIGASALLSRGLQGAAGASDWPQFRGSQRDNISKEAGLSRKWAGGGPKPLWSVPVAPGYAGAAIVGSRLYHEDYDEKTAEWLLNCRSLADGKLTAISHKPIAKGRLLWHN
jgi:hypothetical protein